jgi:limonene-1,2-epoxide hydrolase
MGNSTQVRRDPIDVVSAYHAALGSRDLDGARKLLKHDLRFEGPFDKFDRADDYWTAITRLWGIVQRVDVHHRSASGDEVVTLYDMVTRTPAGTQLVCEWLGVEDGQIAWIRTLFDTAPFAFLRASQSS